MDKEKRLLEHLVAKEIQIKAATEGLVTQIPRRVALGNFRSWESSDESGIEAWMRVSFLGVPNRTSTFFKND